jgi:hypothetical protein
VKIVFSNINAGKEQRIYTAEQLKAMVDYIDAKAAFHRKVTPKFIKINEDYLNDLIFHEDVKNVEFSSDGGITVDYQGIISFYGIPVIIDNTINTYKFVYNE